MAHGKKKKKNSLKPKPSKTFVIRFIFTLLHGREEQSVELENSIA